MEPTAAVATQVVANDTAVMTSVIIAFIAALEALKKWGPAVREFFLPAKDTKNDCREMSLCPQHSAFAAEVTETACAIKSLTERADKHHAEQREDLKALTVTINTSFADVYDRTNEMAIQLAKHGVAIGYFENRCEKIENLDKQSKY
jgi:hypothetical protein